MGNGFEWLRVTVEDQVGGCGSGQVRDNAGWDWAGGSEEGKNWKGKDGTRKRFLSFQICRP